MEAAKTVTDETAKEAGNGVSVVILTCNRPLLLARCIRSALANSHRPMEIVVSDDAFGDASREAVNSVALPDDVILRHIPGPGEGSQSANANSALRNADFESIIFMHDDDYLLDGAVDHLVELRNEFGDGADAIYGRQQLVTLDGVVDWKRTHENDRYYAKNAPEGVQPSRLWCALTGQFPNNGMLIKKSVALKAGYPAESEVGRIPVDFHFSIRYALAATGSYILSARYTSAYSIEGESVLRQSRFRRRYDGHLGYEKMHSVEPSTEAEQDALEQAKDRFAAAAVMGYLSDGRTREALTVYGRHVRRMDKPWPTRIALAGAILSAPLWRRRLAPR